ncbi:MAG: DUF167 domain-containing protein [Deltaproteobacteria bacterium]|nr:DUF167 domain-containing protein [Deltaproteobacteria bacterium]
MTSPELDNFFLENSEGVIFSVFVLPRSSICALAGIHDGALKIKLTKPPVDGEANAECCRFLAKVFDVPKSHIAVVRGAASRHKALQLHGLTAAAAYARLDAAFSRIKKPVD